MAKTVCARDCYDSCSMEVLNRGGKLIIRGDKEHPITSGFLCPRGNREVKRILTNRIKRPHIRRNGKLVEVSWDEALVFVAQRIKRIIKDFGPQSILYLTYDGNAGLIHNQFVHRLWHRIDATLTDMAICTTTGHTILKTHFGESHGIRPIDLLDQKLIVFWGFNAAVTAPHIWAKALEARKNGAKIITIDPLKTATAKNSNFWVRPKFGTDAALALFVINQIFAKGANDAAFLEKYTLGAEKLREAAKQWTLDKTAAFTNVKRRELEDLVDYYIKFRPSATMIGVALQKKDYGWEHIRAIAFIPTVLGYHRGFFYSNGQSYHIDYNYITGAKFHKTKNIIPQVATANLVKQGRFKMIFVSSMNPAQTLPDAADFIEGKKEHNVFLAAVDTHWSRTAQLADVVLPATTFVEKQDVIVSWGHCFTQYSKPAIEPMFDSRNEVWIMRELAKRLNLTDPWLYQDPVEALQIAMKDSFIDGRGLVLTSQARQLRTKPRDWYPTESGKIELYSEKALSMGISPLPEQPPLPELNENQFSVLSTAVNQYTNSQFWEVFGEPEPIVFINQNDAEDLNIKEGQTVKLENEQGKILMKAKISDIVPEKMLWYPRNINDLTGKPVNSLVSPRYQKVGRGPLYHWLNVTLSKI